MGSTPIPGTLKNGNGSAARASRDRPIQFQQVESGHRLRGAYRRKTG